MRDSGRSGVGVFRNRLALASSTRKAPSARSTLSALDNPTVIGLHRRSSTNIRLIMAGDSQLWSWRRGEVHLKEGLTRAQLEDIESVTEEALRWLAAHPTEDVFSAGWLFRISPSTVTRAIGAPAAPRLLDVRPSGA
jgi:hypothetical protein